MTTWMADADDWFRQDAARLGYLKEDPHEPGNGRGLWAYYRDHQMQPPEYLRKVVPRMELPPTWENAEP